MEKIKHLKSDENLKIQTLIIILAIYKKIFFLFKI